jgi:hypothetical protein
MPTFEFTDEQVSQLTVVLANASGPGISWAITNGLLTTLQQQAQAVAPVGQVAQRRPRPHREGDGLDLGEPHG